MTTNEATATTSATEHFPAGDEVSSDEVDSLSSGPDDEETSPTDYGEHQDWAEQKSYAVRTAMLVIAVPNQLKTEHYGALQGMMADALKADSRVSDLKRPALEADWCRSLRMFPRSGMTNRESVLAQSDSFFSCNFRRPFVFRVHADKKNQQPFKGNDDIPSEDYWVAWNGMTAVVLWEQPQERAISTAAGRIVVDVLRDASKRAGLRLYEQACSPGCHNIFTHTNVRLFLGDVHGRVRGNEAAFHMEKWRGPAEQVEKWHESIFYPFQFFTRVKNSGRRIRDIEEIARRDVKALVSLRHAYEQSRSLPLRKRFKARRQMKGWRQRASYRMASLWLALGLIEDLRRSSWDQDRRFFQGLVERNKLEKLFERDAADDEQAIMSADYGLIRSLLDHTGDRLDTRSIAMLTGIAAAAGVIGAVLGGVIGS